MYWGATDDFIFHVLRPHGAFIYLVSLAYTYSRIGTRENASTVSR